MMGSSHGFSLFDFIKESVCISSLMEALGSILGVLGAIFMLFSASGGEAFAAWLFWLFSSAFLMAFAVVNRLLWLGLLQLTFFCINLAGVIKSAGVVS